MSVGGLAGEQYVRLAAGADQAVAPYLGVPAAEIAELLIELRQWPGAIRPQPRPGRDGILLAGDPLLVDAGMEGLVFAGTSPDQRVVVPWDCVLSVQVLRRSMGAEAHEDPVSCRHV
jgi:hypothetical protein